MAFFDYKKIIILLNCLATLTMPSKADAVTQPPPYNEPKEKIAIIGAGLAGLTTAYRLLGNNFDLDVYEARSRVGGRVHTILMKNLEGHYSPVELGAQNITDGGDSTHILTLIKELDLEVIKSLSSLDGQFYDGSQFFTKSDILKELNIDSLVNDIEDAKKTYHSMQAVLDHVF